MEDDLVTTFRSKVAYKSICFSVYKQFKCKLTIYRKFMFGQSHTVNQSICHMLIESIHINVVLYPIEYKTSSGLKVVPQVMLYLDFVFDL